MTSGTMLINRELSTAVPLLAWTFTGSSSVVSGKIELGVTLIAITDVYPLKKPVYCLPPEDTEYFELIKLKKRFFDKVISSGNERLITHEET
jgi:hypothetical protein